MPFFLDSSLGIPYIVLWFNVYNKELLALRDNFRVTKKFFIIKFNWQNVPICVFLCKQTTMSVKIFWRYSHLSFGGPQLYNSEALPYNFLIKTNYKSNCAISTWKISKNHFAIFDSFEKMKLVLNVRDINGLITALHWRRGIVSYFFVTVIVIVTVIMILAMFIF